MTTIEQMNLPASTTQPRVGQRQVQESWLARLAQRVDRRWWKYLLMGLDTVLILVSFGLAYLLRYQLQWFRSVDPAYQVPIGVYTPFAILLIVVLLTSFRLSSVYPYRPGRNWFEEMYMIGTATTTGVIVLMAVSLFYNPLSYSRLIYIFTAVIVTSLLGVSRLVISWARLHLRRYGVAVSRVLLIGVGDVGRMVMRTIAARPDYGYFLVGFLDDHPAKGSTDIGPFKGLGPVDNFAQVLQEQRIEHVIICLPWQSHRLIQRLLTTCDREQVRAQVVPDFFHLTRDQMQVEELNGIPLISKRELSIQGWNYIVKRSSDIVLSLVALVLTLPLMAVIAAAIKLDSSGPLIFSQTRIGKNGKEFRCHKFRSMIDRADEMRVELSDRNEATGPLFKLRDDPRRTRVGRHLRRFSLDELPQLWNVLVGDMSLVGPRPNLPDEVEKYQEWHRKRLAVSPGLTGLWQVSGRSDLTFDEMVLLDIYYVENWSWLFDLSILLRSFPAVLGARGAY